MKNLGFWHGYSKGNANCRAKNVSWEIQRIEVDRGSTLSALGCTLGCTLGASIFEDMRLEVGCAPPRAALRVHILRERFEKDRSRLVMHKSVLCKSAT